MSLPASFPFAAVILAAGRSRRMGRPKLLLPWRGTSILGHLLGQWQALGAAQVVVVHAARDQPLELELDRLGFAAANRIPNPAPDRGMFSSIQCAGQWPGWLPPLTHWALVLGDQPHLAPRTLRTLLEFSRGHPDAVCQPIHAGRRRHPVVLPKAVFLALAASTAADLREFLRPFPNAACEAPDPGLDLDLDTPEDYRKAVLLVGHRGGGNMGWKCDECE